MTCHAMHAIQDLFLEGFFSYALQFDMHFYMHSYVDKNFILVKSGCYILNAENMKQLRKTYSFLAQYTYLSLYKLHNGQMSQHNRAH
jgi:hypothetical protein